MSSKYQMTSFGFFSRNKKELLTLKFSLIETKYPITYYLTRNNHCIKAQNLKLKNQIYITRAHEWTKSSTVTSTHISAKISTPAILKGSSLLNNTPSISKGTADTLPHSVHFTSVSFLCSTFTRAFTTIFLLKTKFFDLH